MLAALDSGWVAPVGPALAEFEERFAQVCNKRYAVAVSSGTAALHLVLLALNVGSGDDVLTSSFTFVATANAIRYVGANPVFVDSDFTSWNMDPELLRSAIQQQIRSGRKPAAIVPVDLFGQCADYEQILLTAEEYGIPVIEDAAESLGATLNGKPAGSFGQVSCFSFNGNKIMTTSGGGMVVTDDFNLASRVRHLATQARDPAVHYEHSEVGYNYRLSNVLAALGVAQLSRLPDFVESRRRIFDRYVEAFGEMRGLTFMPEFVGSRGSRWLTCILLDDSYGYEARRGIIEDLKSESIEARPLWKPMHLQPLYAANQVFGGDVSQALFERGLCLPSGSGLTVEDQDKIIDVVKKRLEKHPDNPFDLPSLV